MSRDNIKIFILVGGFGTRLREVVSNVPKPMAPVNEKPFLSYKIEMVRKYMPDNKIYLLTHYMSDIIKEFFVRQANINIIKEKEALGTGGSLKNAIMHLDLCDDESIMVLNGDTYIEANYIDFMNKSTSDINIMVKKIKDCGRFNTLEIKEQEVIEFKDKNIHSNNEYINIGCYIFNDLTFIKRTSEKVFSIENKFKEIAGSINIKPYEYHGEFIDIGIPSDYKKLINEKFNEKK